MRDASQRYFRLDRLGRIFIVGSTTNPFLIDFITLHMLILYGAAQTEPFNRNQKAARRVVAAASQLALRV